VFIGAVIIRDVQRGFSDHGFGGAIRAAAERAPLPVIVGRLPAEGLPRHVELAAYFVVSEALTDVAKHASASEVSVTATMNHGRLTIAVRDDGAGGNLRGRLHGLRDRLAAIEGRLDIKAEPGRGTTIRAGMPCL
jgi:signal transduction histidine kinase